MATLKGTWRFNDNIILPQENTGGAIAGTNIAFTLKLTLANITYIASCSFIELYLNDIKFQFESASPLLPEKLGISLPLKTWVYSANGGWYTDECGEGIQTITFTEEQEVSEEFYTWFTQNAKPVIKAGTYRWNDEITKLIGLSANINFYVSYNFTSLGGGKGQALCEGIETLEGNGIDWGVYTKLISFSNPTDQSLAEAYTSVTLPLYPFRLYRAFQNGEYDFPNDNIGVFMQSFTITEDTQVSPEFYAWFNANAYIPPTLSGTWIFNIKLTSHEPNRLYAEIDFVSNGKNYWCLLSEWHSESEDLHYFYAPNESDQVYDHGMHTNSTPVWLDEAYKTVTFIGENYVSNEFYEWFIENTKEVKAISGKRTFKDKLTQMPFEGGIPINFTFNLTDANFETAEVYTETVSGYGFSQEPYNDISGYEGGLFYHYGGSGFDEFKGKYLYSGLTGWHTHYFGQTREQMSQALILEIPDIDDTTLNYYLDELYKCYGEDIKTVDFGTEPQYIPVDAWDWIMENTEPVIKKGAYRFADTIERPYFNENVTLPTQLPAFSVSAEDVRGVNDALISYGSITTPIAEQDYTVVMSYTGWQMFYAVHSTASNPDDYSIVSLLDVSAKSSPYDASFEQAAKIIMGGKEIYHSFFGGDYITEGYEVFIITEDTAVSEQFATWFNANTVSIRKKFTRLYIGSVVASVGSKCFKRLSTEEPSAEITDLTGTTWYVPSGWSAAKAYGSFDVDGNVDGAVFSHVDDFYVGYSGKKGIYISIDHKADSICCIVDTEDVTNKVVNYTPDTSFTLEITGGADATNADLIAWLSEYGELISTGEEEPEDDSIIGTWTVNETVSAFTERVRIECNGTFYLRTNDTSASKQSITYIGYPNTTYIRNYFAVANSTHGTAFDEGEEVGATSNSFYSVSFHLRKNIPTDCLTFVIESVPAEVIGTDAYQIIHNWLKANATRQ